VSRHAVAVIMVRHLAAIMALLSSKFGALCLDPVEWQDRLPFADSG